MSFRLSNEISSSRSGKRLVRVTLTGYYGAGNLGDDLMLDGLLQHVLKNKQVEVTILQFNFSAPVLMRDYKNVHVVKIPRTGLGRLKIAAAVLRRSDWLVFGGGTCFTDGSSDGSFKLFFLAKVMGVRLAYLGVGIGELSRYSRRLKAAILLRLSTLVTFRDVASFAEGKRLAGERACRKLHLTEDLAYLSDIWDCPRPACAQVKASERWVIVLRPIGQYLGVATSQKFWNNWVRWFHKMAIHRRNLDVVFLCVDDQRDLEISERMCADVRDRLGPLGAGKVSVAANLSPQEKIQVLACADQVIAMRLHACLIATAFGVPTFGIAYCKKVANYFDGVGSSNYKYLEYWISKPQEHWEPVRVGISHAPRCLDNIRERALANVALFESKL